MPPLVLSSIEPILEVMLTTAARAQDKPSPPAFEAAVFSKGNNSF